MIFSARQQSEFLLLLSPTRLDYPLELLRGFNYLARVYRDWVVQQTLEVCRADERAALCDIRSGIAKLQSAVSALPIEQYDMLAGSLPMIERGPDLGRDRYHWLLALRDVARTLADHSALRGGHAGDASELLEAAERLADKLGRADDRSRSRLILAISSGRKEDAPDNDPVVAFQAALSNVEDALADSIVVLATQRGPTKNGNLHQMVAWLDELVIKHTGQPMTHRGGPDGRHSGQPEAASDRFLVAFFGHVHATLPPCLKQLRPALYKSNAALEVLKKHITKRNKSAREAQLA